MKKIDLKPYKIKLLNREGQPVEVDYSIKESIVNLLLSPELKLNGRDLLLAHKLASKVEDYDKESILLETIEYDKIVKAVDTFKGFGKNDVEFCRRILEAESVDPNTEVKT